MKSNNDFRVYLSAYHNEVTGSRFMLMIELPDGRKYRILVDYGYFQEIEYRYLNYVDDLNPCDIDAIIVTHNHLDHTGLIPKAVNQGFGNKIYMTRITKELIKPYWKDACKQQDENLAYIKERYPKEAEKFDRLFYNEDVEKAVKLCEGVDYKETVEIFPGAKVTFYENGHLLGSSMVHVEVSYEKRKPIDFLFTGDYRLKNLFFRVPKLPRALKGKELILVNESTYGITDTKDVKVCFEENIKEAFKNKQHILIGAFAQGRMQETLYRLKLMQEEGIIPNEYEICVDGSLGIKTCVKYQSILKWYNPQMQDFMPKNLRFVDPKSRQGLLSENGLKIVVTTSGMLSNGPAKEYVPMFLERKDALIHLIGYAAEETLARKLLDARHKETVKINGRVYQKRATVKTTREFSSHATSDNMIDFINEFKNIKLLIVNHGEESAKIGFAKKVANLCENVEMVDTIDRGSMYAIYQTAFKKERYSTIRVKKMPAKLNSLVISKKEEVNKKKERKSFKKRNKKH